MSQIRMVKPTAEQCRVKSRLDTRYGPGYCCFYPQMGGYSGICVVIPRNGCFDALVWHDGEFPFHGDEEPVELHHCDAAQFIGSGTWVESLPDPTGWIEPDPDQ